MIIITTLLSENKLKHTHLTSEQLFRKITKLIDTYLNKWLDTFNISDKKHKHNKQKKKSK